MAAWTQVPKPTESSVVTLSGGGEPIGLLMALTYTTTGSSVVSGWTDVAKPVSSTWTAVVKPTSSVWTLVTKPTS